MMGQELGGVVLITQVFTVMNKQGLIDDGRVEAKWFHLYYCCDLCCHQQLSQFVSALKGENELVKSFVLGLSTNAIQQQMYYTFV